jgi:adenine deaminase
LDWVIGRAVSLGLDPIQALTMATINPAETYRLNRRGALAPGYRADVVVLRDEADFRPWRVYKNGRLVAEDGRCLVSIPETSPPDWASPMNLGPLDQNRLEVPAESDRVRVIGLIENQILTEHLVLDAPASDGRLTADPDRDLARLMVFERHHGSGRIGQGLVRGLGLKTGALASSVAHDSHNVIAVGADPADLVCAVEAVAASGGGLAVAVQGRIIAHFPLPLAGLMTDVDAETAAAADLEMQKAAANLGCRGKNPFMALSFLALPVIPSLKLTDRGLVDVDRFDYVPLFA